MKQKNVLFSVLSVLILAVLACSPPAPASDSSPSAESERSASGDPAPAEPRPVQGKDILLEVREGTYRPAVSGDTLSAFPGEIYNASSVSLGLVRIDFVFYNDDGEEILKDRVYADVNFVAPGAVAPYEYVLDASDFPDGEDFASYTVSAAGVPMEPVAVVGLDLDNGWLVEMGGYSEIAGRFVVRGDAACDYPTVVFAGYDADGRVRVVHRHPLVSDGEPLAQVLPGSSTPFSGVLAGHDFDSVVLFPTCRN